MRTVTTCLFYLLLLLIPTQLGRHFFFDFSHILGVRSDYLAPTIYLTDVMIGLMMGVVSINEVLNLKHQISSTKNQTSTKFQAPKTKQKNFNILNFRHLDLFGIWNLGFGIFFLVICYLLFTSIIIASNKWVAIYKLVKIIEFIFLGYIIKRLKPKVLTVTTFLAFDVIYTSLIAVWQFVQQRSIGGIFYFLGERTFYSGTPGIALASLGGRLLLRPYATFPHPNVFGGFLAVVLPLMLFMLMFRRSSTSKIIYYLILASFILGVFSLLLTYSRAAWGVAMIGFLLIIWRRGEGVIIFVKKNREVSLMGFYGLIFLSVIIPLRLSITRVGADWRSLQERADMINATIKIFSTHPVTGVGLNNFIVHLHNYIRTVPDLYVFQPVHNIYLLVLAETGIIGLIFLFIFLTVAYYRSLMTNPLITLVLIQIIFLGFFDHYLFTLQQAQLLFTVFAALALTPKQSSV